MLAIQCVKFSIIRGAVLWSIPPAPIAAFRSEQRLLGISKRVVVRRVRAVLCLGVFRARVGFAGVPKKIPRLHILGVANPNVKIRVDPGCREDGLRFGNFSGGGDGFARSQRAEIRISLNAAIKFTQKFAPISRIVLPGIFPIQKKANGKRLLALYAFANRAQSAVKIGGTRFGIHSAVYKSD